MNWAQTPILVAQWVILALVGSPAGSFAADPAREAAEKVRQRDHVYLRAVEFRAQEGPPPSVSQRSVDWTRVRYWMVSFATDRDLRNFAQGQIVGYIPNLTLLIRGGQLAANEWVGRPGVVRVEPYRPEFKVAPELLHAEGSVPASQTLTVSLFPGEDVEAMARVLADLGAEILSSRSAATSPRLLVTTEPGAIDDLANVPGVEWIEPAHEITKRNDTTRWVAQSGVSGNEKVWDKGLHGQGQIIGHIDGPLHLDSCYFEDLSDNTPGPWHRKVVGYRGTGLSDDHGTHTAGTAVGWNSDGSTVRAGLARSARLSHTVLSSVAGFENTTSNLHFYLARAHDDGARVHTNSWGDDGFTSYTTWARDVDRFARDYEDDLVIFAVSNSSTLRSPENAKNCLAVGATRQAPNEDEISSGGAGPTWDGRRKPELFLPGVAILSAGTSGCSVGSDSGTSMAAPAVAACAALVRQYYEEGFHPSGVADSSNAIVPTGALVKATLLSGTLDLTDEPGYPSDEEGWGRLLLDKALFFDGDSRRSVIRDVRHADGLVTGELDEILVDVGGGESFEVTLAFTDQPAALSAALAPVNDLDLEVEGPDGLFYGNQVTNGWSQTGGSPDPLNNVERVLLPDTLTQGTWTVRVRGAAVPQGPQGYALHITGDVDERNGATDVDLADLLAAAEQPLLSQNQPNPFASETTIRFALGSETPVTLAVFDISGRRVQTLVEQSLSAGEYSVRWDGRDFAGEKVAPGIYFYRLIGLSLDETRKMVILR